MGWLTYGLFFLTGGLLFAVETGSLAGPELTEGTGVLFAIVMLGTGVALIAKTEKR